MASPTLTLLNHQPLTTADANTGWNDLTTPDADIKVEGLNAMSGIFRADGEQGYYDAGTAPVSAAGKTFRGWILTNNLPYMGTLAGDPYKLLAYDGTTTELKSLFGSDTYPGGWYPIIWDMDEFTTLTLANVRRWGVEAGHAISAKNAINTWMDVQRYLDGYSMTGGTSGDKVRLADVAGLDRTSAYGVVTDYEGVYFATGTIQFGTGATAHWFEMDGQVLVFTEQMVSAGLYSLAGVGSGTDVKIVNSVMRSTGAAANTRFVVDMSDVDLASLVFEANVVARAGAVTFKSGQSVIDNTFDDCGQITPNGADMSGCTVKNYEGTADTAALVWDETTDPSGELDNMSFVKGTASTHALELGVNSPLSLTLNGHQYSGYNASNGQTDSTILVSRTSGIVTINVASGGGTPTYKSAGATVVVVSSKTATFTPIENGSAFTITRNSDNALFLDVPVTSGGEVVYSYDGGLDGTATTVHLIIVGREPIDFPWTVAEGTVPVSQVIDRIYSNP